MDNYEENRESEVEYPYISSDYQELPTISTTSTVAWLPYEPTSSSLVSTTVTTARTPSSGNPVANASFSQFLADVGGLGIIAVGAGVLGYAIYQVRKRKKIQKKVNSLADQLRARDKQDEERNNQTRLTIVEERPTETLKRSKKEKTKDTTSPKEEIKLEEVKPVTQKKLVEASVSAEFKSPPKPSREIQKIKNPYDTTPQLTPVKNKLQRTKSLDMETPFSTFAKRRMALRRSISNVADHSMPEPMELFENNPTENLLESDFQGMETCSVRNSPVIQENIPFHQLEKSLISDQGQSMNRNEAQFQGNL